LCIRDRFTVGGELAIRGQTHEVELEVTFNGVGRDPSGAERAGFHARTEFDRRDWGLTWNQALETGGILVGNTVRVDAEVQAVKETGATQAAA
ncbi:MAG: YceI family protein, partial [Gemmatimonadetes bacterium]|nr:YceI family protein [Gemmatimonadota bacterium]